MRGRVHAKRTVQSTATAPGPDYYDTVTAVTSVSGTASYHGIAAVTGAKRIRWPTTSTSDITQLSTLAAAVNLSFAPASGTSGARCTTTPTLDLSVTLAQTMGICSGFFALTAGGSAINVPRGSRLRFRKIDVNNNGTIDPSEGFVEIFDLAAGIDTSSLRADIPKGVGVDNTIVTLNQCGLMMTNKNNGRKEFFPVARFRELWVRARLVDSSSAPALTLPGDTATMGQTTGANLPTTVAVSKILGYGTGYSRCFSTGSPYLMLTERYVSSGTCGSIPVPIDSSLGSSPYAWGAVNAGCIAATYYGGQDTTFTANVRRCAIRDTQRCDNNPVRLGSWRLFGGTSTAAPPASIMQAVEVPYIWPISSTYNAASRGVISATAGPLFVSDTVRGYVTLYINGSTSLIDDVVYDKDPTASDALCRNFLGIVSTNSMRVANNALNIPRPDPSGTFRFLGTPNYNLNAAVLILTGSFTYEDSIAVQAMATPIACNGIGTSGGCINHTGSVAAKLFRLAYTPAIANSGMVFNRTPDPCQS